MPGKEGIAGNVSPRHGGSELPQQSSSNQQYCIEKGRVTCFSADNINCDLNCNKSVEEVRADEPFDQFKELNVLIPFYSANMCNVKFAHININSLRHKFDPLVEALSENLIDVLMIQETKLDENLPVVSVHRARF